MCPRAFIGCMTHQTAALFAASSSLSSSPSPFSYSPWLHGNGSTHLALQILKINPAIPSVLHKQASPSLAHVLNTCNLSKVWLFLSKKTLVDLSKRAKTMAAYPGYKGTPFRSMMPMNLSMIIVEIVTL